MCGICGIVALGRPGDRRTAEAMATALSHRGPDSSGSYAADGVALGFRRLAIIDRSEAGNQPFGSADGTLQLLHNGEVYNYLELRTELEASGHRFRSATDTEVILAAYEEWGDACVERFNGMWAFALWDERRQRLFCSRDRFGIKPFHYRLAADRFVFASEPKAFLQDPATRLEADPASVRRYLDLAESDHPGETFFSGIRNLPPAHNLVFDAYGVRLRRFWRLEPGAPPDDPATAFRELLADSVRLQLRSDVPIGTCLSGGLDSSAIAVIAGGLLSAGDPAALPLGARQRTFTAYFPGARFDERPFAEEVVRQVGADAHYLTFTADDLVHVLPEIVFAQDEPFGSTSIAAQWHVMREARRAGLTVMLDGQGADEMLAGYHGFFGDRFADLLAGRRLSELREEVGAYRSLHGVSASAALVSTARPFLPASLRRAARVRVRYGGSLAHADLVPLRPPEPFASPYPTRLGRALHLVLAERGLPALLRYEDRNSMTHSLEARVPFLDHRLVELVFSLPAEELIRAGRTKVVLRRALADLLPPLVRDRIDKVGFVTPEAAFFRGALGDLAADVFASQAFATRGFVDAAAARRRLEGHRRGELDAGTELWRALNLELWAKAFLDR